MDNFFFHCAETDMPVLIHISPALGAGYGIVDDLGLHRIEKMLKKYPGLKIIGHSQPFWSEISGDNTEALRNSYPPGKVIEGRLHKLLRDHENLYCDLSAGSGLNAMTRDEDHALRFLDEFQDKIMFATDICSAQNTHHLSISRFYDRLLNENLLSETIYRKICRENAIRILKLDTGEQKK
jgi:predicted TIM-barrel fold metal-dependent hydrolase